MQRDWNFCSQHFIQLDLSCAAARTQKNIPTQYWLIVEPSSSSSCYAFFLCCLLFLLVVTLFLLPFMFFLCVPQFRSISFLRVRLPHAPNIFRHIHIVVQQRKVMIEKRERMMHTLRSDAKNLESKKNVHIRELLNCPGSVSKKKAGRRWWSTTMIFL